MSTFQDPDCFTAAAVGPPGRRVFYLQVRAGSAITSVKLEKQQVQALAEYLAGMLHDLPAPSAEGTDTAATEPIEEAWTVGSIGVAYDNDRDRVVIVAEELVFDDDGLPVDPAMADDDPDEPSDASDEGPEGRELRVVITRSQVRGLIQRANELVAGGRAPCRLCGAPMDPAGHPCPREN